MAWGREETEADSPLGVCCNIQADVIREGLEKECKRSNKKMVVPAANTGR